MSFDANENGPLMSFVVAAAETAAQNDLFVAIFLLSDLFLGCRVLQLRRAGRGREVLKRSRRWKAVYGEWGLRRFIY